MSAPVINETQLVLQGCRGQVDQCAYLRSYLGSKSAEKSQ